MKNLTKVLGIAGITTLSFLPLKSEGQETTDNFNKELLELFQKTEKFSHSKVISAEIQVSEYRDIFQKPLSFILTYNLSDSSKFLVYYSDICKQNKIREFALIDSKGKKEDLTSYMLNKNELKSWFKDTQRQLRKCPPGVYKAQGL